MEQKSDTLRIAMPVGGPSLLVTGIMWIGLITWGFWDLWAGGQPPLLLVLAYLPGLALLGGAALRLGKRICFELSPDSFGVRGLGLLARSTQTWNRRDIASFKIRNTSDAIGDRSGLDRRPVRLVIELRSGSEVILVRSGDSLSLGSIATALSEALGAGGVSDSARKPAERPASVGQDQLDPGAFRF